MLNFEVDRGFGHIAELDLPREAMGYNATRKTARFLRRLAH